MVFIYFMLDLIYQNALYDLNTPGTHHISIAEKQRNARIVYIFLMNIRSSVSQQLILDLYTLR